MQPRTTAASSHHFSQQTTTSTSTTSRTLKSNQLDTLKRLLDERQQLNQTHSFHARRAIKLHHLANAAVSNGHVIPLHQLPHNYVHHFTHMFTPLPNLFTTSVAIDVLYTNRNKTYPVFLRSLLDAMMAANSIYTTVYLDNKLVFDPHCKQPSTEKVTGARKLCRTTIVNKQLRRLCSTDAKPWFELYRSLEADLYEMTRQLEHIQQEKIYIETCVIRAVIGNEAVEKHWQTMGVKIYLLLKWTMYVRNKKRREKENMSLFMQQYFITTKFVEWGYRENTNGFTTKRIEMRNRVREKRNGNNQTISVVSDTPVLVWVDDGVIVLHPRTPSLSNRQCLILKQCLYYWRSFTMLSAAIRFQNLLTLSLENEQFLKWDCRRIKNFTLKLNSSQRTMREMLLKLPHQISMGKMALVNLQKAAQNSGTQEERIVREKNLEKCFNVLLELTKRIGNSQEEQYATVFVQYLKVQFTSTVSLRSHVYHQCSGNSGVGGSRGGRGSSSITGSNLLDKTAAWEMYLMTWYTIQRRILSYLNPSTWPSSPLSVLQRSTLHRKDKWCEHQWYNNNVTKAQPGWGWCSSVYAAAEEHRACFRLVEDGMTWGSAGAKQVAFGLFRNKCRDIEKNVERFRLEYSEEVEKGVDINLPLRALRGRRRSSSGNSSGGGGDDGDSSRSKHDHSGHKRALPLRSSPNMKKNKKKKSKHKRKSNTSRSRLKPPFGQKRKDFEDWSRVAAAARQKPQKDGSMTDDNMNATSGVVLKKEISQMTKKERRQHLLHENILRSFAEQHEFVLLDDKTIEQILKLDMTSIDTTQQRQQQQEEAPPPLGENEEEERGGTTEEDLMMAIREACPVVKRVYGYYKSGRSMNKGDYIQFIQQSRVVSRRNEAGLQAADVELLWLKCSRQAMAVREGKTPALLPHQFMEVCLRIASIKYENNFKSVPKRMERLCLEDLRWNARQSDADAFRARLVEDDVLMIWDRFIDRVSEIFKTWSRKRKMSLRNWKSFVDILQLEETSSRLGSRQVESAFHKAQSGSVGNSGAGEKAEQQTEEQIEYEASVLDSVEFWEVLNLLSVYESPDPYLTVGRKMSNFIEKTLIPRFECYQENGEHGVKNYIARENYPLAKKSP
jgi:hypothetical protein